MVRLRDASNLRLASPTELRGSSRSRIRGGLDHPQGLAHRPSVAAGKRNAEVDAARVKFATWLGYEDRWDLLDNSAFDAPVLLPQRLRGFALEPRVGLPPNHPWTEHLPNW
jgi:hypothetical protein